MILVDKNINELCLKGILISEGYIPMHTNSISYDLTLGEFLDSEEGSIDLIPGEFVMIKTKEKLSIPNNITGRIGEKNSLLRLGLKVDGPQYQPGHITYAFLRVQNISNSIISIQKNMRIAQIYFEELKEEPDRPYSEQPGASYHNEDNYRGFGAYDREYKSSIKSFEKVKDDIESLSHRIYGNVLTLMGVLVAIFSMLSINYQAFTNADLSPKYVSAMNLSLTFCIAVMLGMVLILVNGWRKKWFSLFYGVVILALGISVLIFCII